MASRLPIRMGRMMSVMMVANARRNLSTTTQLMKKEEVMQVHPGYAKNKAKYEKFQRDDGVPVHLKGGPMDKVLYITTLFMCGIGLIMTFRFYYQMSFPKKPSEC